jgi:hypothetical protein
MPTTEQLKTALAGRYAIGRFRVQFVRIEGRDTECASLDVR